MNAFLSPEHTKKWRVSLHQLTALDAKPIDLIDIAGRLACDHVCLFTHVPEQARHIYPVVGEEDVAGVRAALAGAGVSLFNLEVFPLDRDDGLDRFAPGLAVGASLGAKRATAHIHEADTLDIAVARFGAFCDLASSHGIEAGLEFNRFSAVADLTGAAEIVRQVGRGSVVLDMLHLIRAGEGVDAVRANADLVSYAQISDGPMAIAPDQRWREAVSQRALPGDGEFDLETILAQLGEDIVLEVEIPQKEMLKMDVNTDERCRRAVEATRALIGQPALARVPR